MEDNISKNRVSFDGTGGKLFGILLVNLLLTIVTFGIYYFWAVVKVRKYFHNHTSILNGRLDYHVTGAEKFFAFIKAMLLLSFVFLLLFGLSTLISMLGLPLTTQAITILLFYLLILLMWPLILVAARRFTMSRTSWNSVHFKFTGRVKEAIKIYIKGIFLSIVSLGLYTPWFIVSIRKFLLDSTYLGNSKFNYTGTGRGLFKYFWPLYIIVIAFYAVIIGFGYWVAKNAENIDPDKIGEMSEVFVIVPLLFTLLGIIFFVAFVWYTVKQYQYHWQNTSVNEHSFLCDIKVGQFIGLQIAAGFITMFTLGIAFPWAIVMVQKYMLETISIDGDVDLTEISSTPDTQKSSALAEAVEEAGGFLESIADFIA